MYLFLLPLCLRLRFCHNVNNGESEKGCLYC